MRVFLLALLLMAPVRATEPPSVLPFTLVKVLKSPQGATLYSLEPWTPAKPTDPAFYHFKVLGKTALDAHEAKLAAGAFQDAVHESNGFRAKCFDPRHALSIPSFGHTYDFLLCYNCHKLVVYEDGAQVAMISAAGSPEALNKLFKAHGVPISKTGGPEWHPSY